MSYDLLIKPQAEIDLLESAVWYNKQKEGLWSRLLNFVEQKIKEVQDNPLHYQLRYKNVRLALIKPFPYAIHFTIEEQKIFILAVLSTHRNPKIWE